MKKSDTIEFVTSIPGLHNMWPLEHSNDVKFHWMRKLNSVYKEQKKIPGYLDEHNSIRKCPGIFKVVKEGFIYRQPWDLKISFESGDLKVMSPWQAEGKQIPHYMEFGPSPAVIQPAMPGINRTIVKLASPWRIKAPYGLQFLFIPIPYPDTYQFESTIGILEPEVSNEINPQLWWNRREEYLLKAGTPIMQIIPLTDKKFNLVCREEDDRDRAYAENVRTNRSLTFNFYREKLIKIYEKYSKGEKF